ncbi:MAG: sugar-binding domain-containing protein [Acidobacteriaceae bacterium]
MAAPLTRAQQASGAVPLLRLHEGWALASGCHLSATGAQLSAASYHADASSWTAASVPSTVLAAQVSGGQFKDPYFDRNLRAIPGTDYPIGKVFSRMPMSPNSPYACPWWYRTRFAVPVTARGRTLWLRFGGINYRANIWINGQQLAASTEVAGAYRTYEFDVTRLLKPGQENAIAVETFAPTEHDLAINWVDWNPCPPDKDMGLTGDVALYTSGPVSVRSPMVDTHLSSSSDIAELTVYGEIHNASAQKVDGTAAITLLGVKVEQPVTLDAGETRTVVFAPEQFPKLRVEHPPLWWPYQMGEPHLEALRMSFRTGGKVSDERVAQVGIREVTSELTDKGARLFHVNGKPILVRGGGWSGDMLLREQPQRLEQEFEMVRDLHLNAIRLEGKLETDEFYRLADEQGVLVIAGWCCCDIWEQWAKWTPENYDVAAASLRAQMLRIRNHPSLLVWLNGSDNPPPPKVEQIYLDIERDMHWPNPTLSSASARETTVSGKSGVKMTGPYDYVAPSYWLTDPGKVGGAWGFNTETSPGPAIPTESSLRRFLPAASLWPTSDDWHYHSGSGGFGNTSIFDTAMEQSYGKPQSLGEYERSAQAMAYDGERAMFEAYGRNKYTSTGVVQWMLNNAWPSMIWHLYDYYLDAGGGYYGARKACEPLHVQYSYDDHSVVVVNSTYQAVPGLHVKAAVYDLQLHPVYEHDIAIDANADSSDRAFSIPAELLTNDGNLHFVRLALTDGTGREVSENFYWVPAKLAEFDWNHDDYRYTPALQEPDLRALGALPQAHVAVETVKTDADGRTTVRLRNDSQTLAFQIALRALDEHAAPVEPAFWSDNYVSLLPGETKTLTVHPSSHGGTRISAIEVRGWNLNNQKVPVRHGVESRRAQETAAPFARASASASQPRRSDASGTLER